MTLCRTNTSGLYLLFFWLLYSHCPRQSMTAERNEQDSFSDRDKRQSSQPVKKKKKKKKKKKPKHKLKSPEITFS